MFIVLLSWEIVLCGCFKGVFCFYSMNTENYIITKSNHDDNIIAFLFIDDNTFLSCSYDHTIKVWNY